jgi:hypothetical protein
VHAIVSTFKYKRNSSRKARRSNGPPAARSHGATRALYECLYELNSSLNKMGFFEYATDPSIGFVLICFSIPLAMAANTVRSKHHHEIEVNVLLFQRVQPSFYPQVKIWPLKTERPFGFPLACVG